MSDKIYLFIEGDDEEYFFRRVICPLPGYYNNPVLLVKYASGGITLLNYAARKGVSRYCCMRDHDHRRCITETRQDLRDIMGQHVTWQKIFVVKQSIEAWYLAGLPDEACHALHIAPIRSTEEIDKREFHRIMKPTRRSKLDIYTYIMDRFCLKLAMARSESLRYFIDKNVPALSLVCQFGTRGGRSKGSSCCERCLKEQNLRSTGKKGNKNRAGGG